MERRTKQFPIQVKQAAGERRPRFIVSTGTVDRERDTINPHGWDLAEFQQTGSPVLWGHQYAEPPIGRAVEIGVQGEALVATVEFPEPGIYPLSRPVR